MRRPDARRQIGVVARREWGERVRRPGFWATVLVGVLLVLAAQFGPALANRLMHPVPTARAYRVAPRLLEGLYRQAVRKPRARLRVVEEASRARALAAVREGRLDGFFSLSRGRLVYSGHPDQVSTLVGSAYNARELTRYLGPSAQAALAAALARHGLEVLPVRVSQRAVGGRLAVFLLGIVLYMVVLTYGVVIGISTVEEKETRHAEMLLSRLEPTTLLWGKVLGIGALAALQLLIWTLAWGLAVALSGGASATSELRRLPPTDFLLFGLFAAVGYLQYGTIFAGLASRATRASEMNQATLPVLVPIMLAYFGTVLAMSGPTGPVARVLSISAYVPFLAPLMGFAQLQLGGIHWWGVLLDLLLQAVFVWLSMRYAAVLFKRHLLDYRPLRRGPGALARRGRRAAG